MPPRPNWGLIGPMGQNLIYVAAVCQILSLPIALAIWLDWKPKFMSQQSPGPIAPLAATSSRRWKVALGLALAVVQLSSWGALYMVHEETQKKPAMATPNMSAEESRMLAQFPALTQENTQLKAENTRLRKTRTPRVVEALPMPSASASIAPITPSKLSIEDCEDLTRAQQLWDSAEEDRIKAAPNEFNSVEGGERYRAALLTESEALVSLERIEARLCTGKKVR